MFVATSVYHLYTWVDVDEYFAVLAASGHWAPWLLEVDAYWDGVELTIVDGTETAEVWQWLTVRLGPLTVDPKRQVILLESVDGAGEPLPVRMRYATEVADPRRLQSRVVGCLCWSVVWD